MCHGKSFGPASPDQRGFLLLGVSAAALAAVSPAMG
jgi:hypothetical protein